MKLNSSAKSSVMKMNLYLVFVSSSEVEMWIGSDWPLWIRRFVQVINPNPILSEVKKINPIRSSPKQIYQIRCDQTLKIRNPIRTHIVCQIIRQMYHRIDSREGYLPDLWYICCLLSATFTLIVYCTSKLLSPNVYNLNFKLWTKHMLNKVQYICAECNCVKKPKWDKCMLWNVNPAYN